MNRSELVLDLAEKSHISPEQARQVIDTMFDIWKKALLNGDRIEVRGFGSFFVKEYEPYKGRNPRTGESVAVKPKKLPFFKCGKDLYDRLNED